MGVELVLSLRLPPLYGASALPPQKALLEHVADLGRRHRSVAAADVHSNHSESNPDSRFQSFRNKYHHHYHDHQQPQQHHQHQHFQHQHPQFSQQFQPHYHQHHSHSHPWQGCLDTGKQSGRLGSGFFIASESDLNDSKQEHGNRGSLFFHDAQCSSSVSAPIIGGHFTIHGVCLRGDVAGIDLPLSLRMLKKKQQELEKSTPVSGFSKVGNSLLNAFSSVVSMMKTLQSHTLYIHQHFFEQDIEGLLIRVQREMHASFLWLFQQVFACTPELMVLVMVLLADFTAFSMDSNLLELPISLYTPPVSIMSSLSNSKEIDKGYRDIFEMSFKSSPSIADKADGLHNSGGSVGNGGRGVYHIAGDADGDSGPYKHLVDLNKAPYSVDDNFSTEISSTKHSITSHDVLTSQFGLSPNNCTAASEEMTELDFSAMAAASAFQELTVADERPTIESSLPPMKDIVALDFVKVADTEVAVTTSHPVLDQIMAQSLVAPVNAKLEDDSYSCYDRTDLAYQHAISSDSNNSLLLANYAQFLFLVRKDHDRAEELFRKAVVCDPFDCDAISLFASFLWLARRNLGAAEKAYQAAIRADPTNTFHAAKYAHFLWNSGL